MPYDLSNTCMHMLEENQTPPIFLSANSILAIARVDIFEGLDVPERSLFSFSSKVDSSSSLPLPPPLPLRRGGKFWRRRRLRLKLEEVRKEEPFGAATKTEHFSAR